MTEVPLVAIEHLSKTFPGQRALNDVSLTIDRAEIHALVGENGSGKSTLIKVLSGFHLPDTGSRIVIDGEELPFGAPEASRRLGLRFVHQDLALIEQLSAADNVGIESGFRRGRGGRIRWQEQQEHARRVMANIGVEVDVRRPVAELRPVDRSTIAIARALDDAQGAIRLLVLDEPTAALPPAEVDALFRVLRDVAASGVSILYVSHRLDEILGLASRVSVLRDGTFQGTHPAAGMQRQHLIRLIVGEDSTNQVVASQQAAKKRSSATGSAGFTYRGIRTDRLAGVDLTVGQGEILGVAGLTGSGREEMAAALCGAIPAELTLTTADGAVSSGMTPRRAKQLGIALVLANRHPAAAIRQFTVRENVTLPVLADYARLGRINTADERGAVSKVIRAVDLRPPDPDRAYELLSGGNKQKTILAKWLNTSPKLLVLDDPTSGVDIGARHAIYDLVRERTAQGVSVVICSSDIEDLVGVCDRVITLVAGNVSGALIGADITEEALLDAILRAADQIDPTPTGKELQMTEQTVVRDSAVDAGSPWQRVWSVISYRNIGAVYVWIVLIIIFTAWKFSLFWHIQTAKTVLNQYSITGLAALSIVVPLAAGIFDLSIGSTMGLAGVGAGWLFQHTSWNPAIVFILVLLGSAVVGLFNSFVVVLLRIDSFIGTLATGAVLGAITLGVSGDQTFTARINGGFSRTASASWGGIQIPVLYMFVLLLILGYFLEQTTTGRYCYATGYNAEVARLVGVRIGRLRTLSLVISATVAGFTGLILTAQIQAADPTNGPSYLIPAFSAAFLGATQFRHGRFNPWGVIVAVLMLGTGSVGLLLAGSPTWAPQIFQGAVLIAAVGVTVVQVRNRRSTA